MTGNREGEHAAEAEPPISLYGGAGARCRMIRTTGALVTLPCAADIGLKGGGAFADVVQPAGDPGGFFPAECLREFRRTIADGGEMMRQRLPILDRSVWQRVREDRRNRRACFRRIS